MNLHNNRLQCVRVSTVAFARVNSPKSIPAVVEAIEKRNYSVEISKADISVMCQYSGGEEETEVVFLCIDIETSISIFVCHILGVNGVI